MRVCIEKLTGKLIESQSGGEVEHKPKDDAISDKEYAAYILLCDTLEEQRLNTLKQNALNTGYLENDIEVKFVTDVEFEAIMEASKPEPTEEQLYEAQIKTKEAEILRRQAIAEITAEKVAEI